MTLDRRELFRRGLGKAVDMAVTEAEQRVNERARHWIRPPYALDELDFLIKCTRCSDCIDACPHAALFPLSARLGIQVVATPAMDLLNNACRLCSDWPCVAACPTGALKRPEPEASDVEDGQNETAKLPLPRLAVASIDPTNCLPYKGPECGACAHSCPVPNALVWDGPKPRIDAEFCVGCALCREACIVEPKAVSIRHSSHAETGRSEQ